MVMSSRLTLPYTCNTSSQKYVTGEFLWVQKSALTLEFQDILTVYQEPSSEKKKLSEYIYGKNGIKYEYLLTVNTTVSVATMGFCSDFIYLPEDLSIKL